MLSDELVEGGTAVDEERGCVGETREVFVDEPRSVLEKVVASDDGVVGKLEVTWKRKKNRLAGEETPNIGEPSSCEAKEREEPLVLGCSSDLNTLVLLHIEKNVLDSQRNKTIALECREEFLNGRFHNSFPSMGIHKYSEYTKK